MLNFRALGARPPCLRRVRALPPEDGDFAPWAPIASGGWGLRPHMNLCTSLFLFFVNNFLLFLRFRRNGVPVYQNSGYASNTKSVVLKRSLKSI